jgi:hypothetical protein
LSNEILERSKKSLKAKEADSQSFRMRSLGILGVIIVTEDETLEGG